MRKGYWLGKKRPEMLGEKHPLWKGGKHKKRCLYCGNKFETYINRYCSKGCGDKSRRGKIFWKKDKVKTVTFTCLNCGVIKTVQEYKPRKFCSQKCSEKYHTGRNSASYKLECHLKRVCLNCNDIFFIDRKTLNRGKERGKFCSNKCVGEYHSGERNFLWNGGKSFEPYTKEFNRLLKRKVKERDNYKCQLCGVPEEECLQSLQIHHIDYTKDNCKMENLISLCSKCHSKTNLNRNYWTRYFQEKIGGLQWVEKLR